MTTDAEGMDRTVIASMCLYGAGCREGHNCPRGHTDAHRQLFTEKKQLREKEWMAPCGFCAAGCCWYGQNCLRSIRSRFSETVYRNPRDDLDSDYASAESGEDSADEREAGEAEGSMHECVEDALSAGMRGSQNFLTADWECCVKGWKPRADAPVCAPVGEAGLFGVLGQGFGDVGGGQKTGSLVAPGIAYEGGMLAKVWGWFSKWRAARSEPELPFEFEQSADSLTTQKVRRRRTQRKRLDSSWDSLEQKVDIAKAKAAALVGVVEGAGVPVQMVGQKEVEVVWAGPASVRGQRNERRVPIGHRGSGMRKMLFADSDEDVSDGINGGSGSGGEGECSRAESRAEIRARQRSAIICQDTTEVKRRAAARLVRRSLPEDSDVAVALVVEMESKREEEMKRRREGEIAELAAGKVSAAAKVQSMRKLQVWEWRQKVQSQQVWVRRFLQGWAWGWERQQGRQRTLRGISEVYLFRAVCVFIGIKRPFELWKRWCRNVVTDRIWYECKVRDLFRDLITWEMGMAWRHWRFWIGVHKAEKVLRSFGLGQLRGATRQWCTKVRRWNSVQSWRWNSVLVRWDEMIDILAECGMRRMQKLG